MADDRAPVWVAVIALLGAIVAGAAIGTPPLTPRGDQAARSFVSEWERSRSATFLVRYDFVRTLPDGNQLRSTTTVVQRPPDDRLVIGLGNVSGRLGGKIVRCAGTPTSTGSCLTSDTAPPYQDEVASEVGGLRSYLVGPRPLYRVIDFGGGSTGCFRLDLAIALPSPPFGDHALFCFDRATAVPTVIEVHRPEAVDLSVARETRTVVTADDLRIPDDRGALVGLPGPK